MSSPTVNNKRLREDDDDADDANLIRRGSRGINLMGFYYGEKLDENLEGNEPEEPDNADLTATVAFHQRRIKALEDMLTQIRFDQLLHVRHLPNSMSMPATAPVLEDRRATRGTRGLHAPDHIHNGRPQRDTNFGLPVLTSAQGLDEVFRILETTTANEDISGSEDDDDITIRAVVYGWPAVTSRYRLDSVWKFMQTFDKLVCEPMGDFGRLASIRAVRAVILHKSRPYNQPLRPIPKFYEPTLLQQTREHPSQIDYFPWPNVRDFLITADHDIRSYPQAAHTNFANNIRFQWPYKVEDTFKTNTSTGQMSFTQEFLDSYHDLGNWQTAIHDDVRLIPAHLQANPHALADHGDLRPVYEREEFRSSALAAQNYEDSEYTPLVRATTVNSSHDGRSNEVSPQMDVSPVNYSSFEAQGVGSDFYDVDALGGSGVAESSGDDWKWAFDDTQPGYGSMQSLFDMAIPL